jgi:hypothetical protein
MVMLQPNEPIPEGLDTWAQLDVILPEQLHHEVTALGDPERRLRLAVLEDALRYFQRYGAATTRHERALYDDAIDWFTSPDRAEPYAFENVCEALNLDPDYIRRGLFRWREAQGTDSAPPFAPRLVSRRVLPSPRLDRRRRAA